MYNIDWNITFEDKGKKWELQMVDSIEIESSVDNLVDTATITLPDSTNNMILNISDKIKRGTKVTIMAGYNGELENEFEGFVTNVTSNDSSLKIYCEDALFLFRKDVKDKEMIGTSIKKIAQDIVSQVIDKNDEPFNVICKEYDLGYEKFVIHQATGYDVLKKIQEETKANIYFNTQKRELHIHPPYVEKGGEVIYSPQVNVEKSSLEFKENLDKKIKVTVEKINLKGEKETYSVGKEGGESITIKIQNIAKNNIKDVADAELLRRSGNKYEGTFDTWLVPMVKPTYTAVYKDKDYPGKDSSYYVVSVKTSISESGGKRTVQLGIKLGDGQKSTNKGSTN